MLVEVDLVALNLGEFNAFLFVINLEDSNTHFCFLLLSILTFSDQFEFNLIMILVYLSINMFFLSQVEDECFFNQIWVACGVICCVLAVTLLVIKNSFRSWLLLLGFFHLLGFFLAGTAISH